MKAVEQAEFENQILCQTTLASNSGEAVPAYLENRMNTGAVAETDSCQARADARAAA